MHIYIVINGNYSDYGIDSVHLGLDIALAYIAKSNRSAIYDTCIEVYDTEQPEKDLIERYSVNEDGLGYKKIYPKEPI